MLLVRHDRRHRFWVKNLKHVIQHFFVKMAEYLFLWGYITYYTSLQRRRRSWGKLPSRTSSRPSHYFFFSHPTATPPSVCPFIRRSSTFSKRTLSKLLQTSNFKVFLLLLLLCIFFLSKHQISKVKFSRSFQMVKVMIEVWDRVKKTLIKTHNLLIQSWDYAHPQRFSKTQAYLIVMALTVSTSGQFWRHLLTSSGHG